jgi:hypothetical protein
MNSILLFIEKGKYKSFYLRKGLKRGIIHFLDLPKFGEVPQIRGFILRP